jgi:hypothetical protein
LDTNSIITPFSDNYQVNIGEKVAIPCIASGVPKPEIVWTRIDSQSNETSSLNVQGGILSLENAKKNQSGNYMCTVFNGARRFVRYGNTGCGVFKGGIQTFKDFWLKFNCSQMKLPNLENWSRDELPKSDKI